MIERIVLLIQLIKRMLSVMEKKHKKRIPRVLLIILLGGIFDVFSISALLPLAQAVLDKNVEDDNAFSKVFTLLFGTNGMQDVTLYLAIVVIAIFILKNAYMIFQTNYQARYVATVRTDISKKMMRGYISCSYSFFVDGNSSEMLRGLTTDVAAFVATLENVFSIIVKVVNIVLLLVLMAASNFIMTLSVAIVGALVILIITFGFKRPMKYFGELNRVANQEVLNSATQTVTGIKEVKILHKDGFFVDFYGKAVEKLGRTEASYKTISACPERVIETAFVIVVGCSLCFIRIDSFSAILPSLIVFGAALIKLLPYISQLSGCFSIMVYYYPATDAAVSNIEKGMRVTEDIHDKISMGRMKYNDIISFDKISFSYNESTKIFNKASFSIKKGDSIGIIGPSGAGKTTLADIILGLREIDEKMVYVDGKEYELDEYTWNGLMGYVSQSLYMLDDSIKHNIAFGQNDDEIDEEKIWEVVRMAQLLDFVETLPDGLDSKVGEVGAKISGGQKQRIAIARALYYEPEIVVLDEATSALDNDTEAAVMEAINALQGTKTLVIIAHRLTTVKNCTHIYRVENGTITEIDRNTIFG